MLDVRGRHDVVLASADLTIANKSGDTALHLAARIGDATKMQSVLEHMTIQPDADLNAVNKAGQTALLVILDQIIMVVNKNTKCQHQYALH